MYNLDVGMYLYIYIPTNFYNLLHIERLKLNFEITICRSIY